MILDSRYHLTGMIKDFVHPKEFGALQSGHRLLDHEQLWIRSIDLSQITLAIKARLSILRKLDHPCILRCYAVLTHRGTQYVVLEQPSDQTILGYLQSSTWTTLSDEQQSERAATILTQIAQVIQYLDQRGGYTLDKTDLGQMRIVSSPNLVVQISGYGVIDLRSDQSVSPNDARIEHVWSRLMVQVASHLRRDNGSSLGQTWSDILTQLERGNLRWSDWLVHPISGSTMTFSKPMTMPTTPNLEERVNSASPLGWSNLSRSKPESIMSASSCPRETEFGFYMVIPNSH